MKKHIIPVLLAALLVPAVSHAAHFRNSAYLLLGGTASVGNSFLWGVSLSAMNSHFGLYLDAKTACPRGKVYDFSEKLAHDLGDKRSGSADDWTSIDACLVLPVYRLFALYAGLGVTAHIEYQSYYDSYHILSSSGKYFVKSGDEMLLNALGGIFVLMDKWVIQVGAENAPPGICLGISRVLMHRPPPF